jgi:SPP1 family predicted phage head-tail adaptor
VSGAPTIGALTDRVDLKRRTTTDEAEGGEAVSFVPIATVWARVTTLAARQALAGDARGQAISHAVVIRFRTDLKPGDRIVYRGATLDIAATGDLTGGRAYLSCQCTEQAVTG